jgi:hypothetical protein
MRKLRKLLPPGAELAAEPEYVAGMDFLPEGILEIAAAHRIELIVMGANRTTSPRMAGMYRGLSPMRSYAAQSVLS